MTNNGNGTQTATVETLTAEVRVLMVGSRQITPSVVKQLDRVNYERVALYTEASELPLIILAGLR